MRSELPWVQVVLFFYAESVVAKTFPVGNNPFGVSCCWGMTFTQGSALRIATLIVGKVLRSGRWERQVAVAAFLSFLLLFSFFVEGVEK